MSPTPMRTASCELYRSRGGHYDVYEGGADHDNVLNVEVVRNSSNTIEQHLGNE